MRRWLEDVFLKVHTQLLITVLIEGTHMSDFEMRNCLKSSVTLVICNLSTGSISEKTPSLVRGDSIYCSRSSGYNLNQSDWISPSAFCAKLETALETVSRPSFFFSCSFNLLHCYSKKEGVVNVKKTDAPSMLHLSDHMVTLPIM